MSDLQLKFLLVCISIAGATASWIPFLLKYIKPLLLKIHVGRFLSIGYNNRGMEVSIDVALVALNKTAFISKIELDIMHIESKDQRTLEWDWLEDLKFTVEGSEKTPISIKKNHSITFLSINKDQAVEKNVSFYSPIFLTNTLNSNLEIERKLEETTDISLCNINSYKELIQSYKENLKFWQRGKYQMTLKVYDSSLKKPKEKNIKFNLTTAGIERINSNLNNIIEYININQAKVKDKEIVWLIQKINLS